MLGINFLLLILLLIVSIVYLLLFSRLSKSRSTTLLFEKLIVVVFLTIAFGVTIFPFNHLAPSALVGFDKKDWSLILQLLIYAVIALLIRSRFCFIFQTSKNLLKAPFILGLLLLTTLSTTWSETPFLTLKSGVVLFGTAIFATYISSWYNWAELTKLLRCAITSIGLASIPAAILLPSVGRAEKGWNGLLGHPNPFGILMALNAVLWLVNGLSYPQYRRRSLILFCMSVFELILANSGGAIVTFVTLLVLLFTVRSIKKLDFRQSFVAMVFIIGFTIVGGLWFSSNLEFLLGLVGKDITLTGRTDFWPQIIEAILKRPILGYGYNGFWQPWRGESNPAAGIIDPSTRYIPPHSHNGYLDLGLNLGIVGIFLFVFSLVQALYHANLYGRYSRFPEAIVPFLLLAFLLVKNFSEAGLWILGQDSFLYILITSRLAIDGLGGKCDQAFQPRSDFETLKN